jgi:hypothetical protein
MTTVPEGSRRGQSPAASVDHVSTRLDSAAVARLDALAPFIAPLGSKPARSVAVRACILTGLDVLETKHAKGST